MDVREKLVELLDNFPVQMEWHDNEELADHLITHGVTVQECAEISDELLKQLKNAPITILQEEPTIEVVQEWISVKDRLPEDASTVLAIDSDGTISSAYYVGRWHSGGDLDEDAVTYWMPLPTAPKEDK